MQHWFYLAAAFCFIIGTVLNMRPVPPDADPDEPEHPEPFGFRVYDGGVVDGGESEWEDEY